MPELPDQIPGEIIAADTTNVGQRRMVQRYATVAIRDIENPTPEEGDLAYIVDDDIIWVFKGSAWGSGGWLHKTGGSMKGDIDMVQNNIRNLPLPTIGSHPLTLTWHLQNVTWGTSAPGGSPADGSLYYRYDAPAAGKVIIYFYRAGTWYSNTTT